MKITELQEGVEYYMVYKGHRQPDKYQINNGFLAMYNEHYGWKRSEFAYNAILEAEFEPCEWEPKIGDTVYYTNPWCPTVIECETYCGHKLDLLLMSRLGYYRTEEEAIERAKKLGWI